MDKTLIKEVRYSHKNQMLVVKFNDGSGYGETGKNALKTLSQLNDNNVEVFETDNTEGDGKIY